MHSGAQVSGVPFGNAGDHVGGPGQSQRGRKAADDRYDLPFKPERRQGFIDRSPVEPSPRHQYVPAGRIASRKQPRAYSLRPELPLLCAEPACEALPLAELSLPADCWLPWWLALCRL